ncbi:MAG: DNA adenine methylase [bacterium]|nr:DNA adenine methylase [bacterium]
MSKPFVKWPGGKSEEVGIIHQYKPDHINNYIEPFLGGGAPFLSFNNMEYQAAYLNDFSDELIDLYTMIKERNELFIDSVCYIWSYWCFTGELAREWQEPVREMYGRYKENVITDDELKSEVNALIEQNTDRIFAELPKALNVSSDRLITEFKKSVLSKLKNTKRKEGKDGDLPEEDYQSNFESGIRASLYTYYRYLYNKSTQYGLSRELHVALFFYLREFCYSSMFRYNNSGEFNVPYGGLSYNNKNFGLKIAYIMNDDDLHQRLDQANLYNLDFEAFLRGIEIDQNDFMFLDPPYDGGFSDYANNVFDQEDQKRLADYLIDECPCRFMLIIKNTDFIADLYNGKPGIYVTGFGKDYRVSFMDRNNKSVKHLIISNYELPEVTTE